MSKHAKNLEALATQTAKKLAGYSANTTRIAADAKIVLAALQKAVDRESESCATLVEANPGFDPAHVIRARAKQRAQQRGTT